MSDNKDQSLVNDQLKKNIEDLKKSLKSVERQINDQFKETIESIISGINKRLKTLERVNGLQVNPPKTTVEPKMPELLFFQAKVTDVNGNVKVVDFEIQSIPYLLNPIKPGQRLHLSEVLKDQAVLQHLVDINSSLVKQKS